MKYTCDFCENKCAVVDVTVDRTIYYCNDCLPKDAVVNEGKKAYDLLDGVAGQRWEQQRCFSCGNSKAKKYQRGEFETRYYCSVHLAPPDFELV